MTYKRIVEGNRVVDQNRIHFKIDMQKEIEYFLNYYAKAGDTSAEYMVRFSEYLYIKFQGAATFLHHNNNQTK